MMQGLSQEFPVQKNKIIGVQITVQFPADSGFKELRSDVEEKTMVEVTAMQRNLASGSLKGISFKLLARYLLNFFPFLPIVSTSFISKSNTSF